jgi:hypothetical protein
MTATLRTGDIVRVVLEGQVVGAKPHGAFAIRNLLSWIEPNGDYLKSVEIIKPARPSVADLPAWAVVKIVETGELAQRTAATDTWISLGGAHERFTHADIDRRNWVQLVEATNG